MHEIKISIVICTYNRVLSLQQALRSLVNQSLDRQLYEIIIVDNNSTDGTSKVVKKIQEKIHRPKIIFLREKNQGLGISRNNGIKHAKGKYIAFIDDDATCHSKYLELALNYFSSHLPKLFAVGGYIVPRYVSYKPDWFKDAYEEDYKGGKERFLKPGESFSGSNMVFQKDILKKYFGFNEAIGMKGDIISTGEETHLFEKIWKSEKGKDRFYYSPKLIIYHTVPAFKMKVTYRFKRAFAGGQALFFRVSEYSFLHKIFLCYYYASIIFLTPFNSLFRLITSQYLNQWLVESFTPAAYAAGFLGAYFHFSPAIK